MDLFVYRFLKIDYCSEKLGGQEKHKAHGGGEGGRENVRVGCLWL